jgi:Bacterial RNA polymerase, alpha chain C terminal domain
MTEEREAQCVNCRFWLAGHEDIGECRRRAPLPTLRPLHCPDGALGTQFAYWPVTSNNSWCGEFEAKSEGANAELLALSVNAERIGFSARILNSFDKYGRRQITTVGDLVQREARDLLELRNFGQRSLAEVRNKLAKVGLQLKGDPRRGTREEATP